MAPLECLEKVAGKDGYECEPEPRIDHDLDKLLHSHLRRGASDHMQSVDLRILMARLPGEDVASVGEMLSIKPKRLRGFLHGEAYLNETQARRVRQLLEVTRLVAQVVEPIAISRWLDAEVPKFGRAPRVLLASGKGEALHAHVARYRESTFS